jgi:hypothetical protein
MGVLSRVPPHFRLPAEIRFPGLLLARFPGIRFGRDNKRGVLREVR